MFFTGYLNCVIGDDIVDFQTLLKISDIASKYRVIFINKSPLFTNDDGFINRANQVEDEYLNLRRDAIQENTKVIACMLGSTYHSHRFFKQLSDNVFLLSKDSDKNTDKTCYQVQFLKKRGNSRIDTDLKICFDFKSLIQ